MLCDDGVDNDGDGLTDCEDDDCAEDPACQVDVETVCDDGVDNDGDGLTDCDDPDCAAHPTCAPEANCTDSVDNDLDSFTDCEDLDCNNDPACQGTGFSCQVLSYCYRCCAAGDQACFQACDGVASPAGLQQMNALITCTSQNCGAICQPAWECYPCAIANCASERDNCGLNPQGTGGCSGIYSCIGACPSLPAETGDAATCPVDPGLTCIDGCFVDSDQQAVDLFIALYYCMLDFCYTECYTENFGSNCNNCGMGSCSAELGACLGDT
jgi:hypothetical protein